MEEHIGHHATSAATSFLSQIQWSYIAAFIILVVGGYYFLHVTLKRFNTVDVLGYFGMKDFMKSRWYPFVFQLPALVFFVLIAFYLFTGPQEYSSNPGAILVWTFWWALLPFTFIVVGRFWCAVCPFAWISDFVQKIVGLQRRPPLWLKRYSFWIIDIIFIFITWFDRVYGMTEHPILSGFIFAGILTGILICAVLYEKRTFCRYICFLGNVAGNYSMVAPLEMTYKDVEVCRSCKEKYCVLGDGKKPGCPYSQSILTKDGNRFCTLCANCVKVCPHDNVALVLRPFGSDFWKRAFVKFEESFFAKILVGIVIIQNIGMLSLWTTISEAIEGFLGISNQSVIFTITYFTAISLPLLFMFVSSFFSALASKEKLIQNFARFGYAFIAVDLAGHLAHNLKHLLGEGKTVVAAFVGLFSGKVEQAVELAVMRPETIKVFQYLILGIGVVGTFLITYFIAKKKAETKKELLWTVIPHILLLTALMILNFYIFSLPMDHRSH